MANPELEGRDRSQKKNGLQNLAVGLIDDVALLAVSLVFGTAFGYGKALFRRPGIKGASKVMRAGKASNKIVGHRKRGMPKGKFDFPSDFTPGHSYDPQPGAPGDQRKINPFGILPAYAMSIPFVHGLRRAKEEISGFRHVWHGTATDFAFGIEKSGLVASMGGTGAGKHYAPYLNQWERGRTFVTNNRPAADNYAKIMRARPGAMSAMNDSHVYGFHVPISMEMDRAYSMANFAKSKMQGPFGDMAGSVLRAFNMGNDLSSTSDIPLRYMSSKYVNGVQMNLPAGAGGVPKMNLTAKGMTKGAAYLGASAVIAGLMYKVATKKTRDQSEEVRAAAISKIYKRHVNAEPPRPGAVQRLHDVKIGHHTKSHSKKDNRVRELVGGM